MRIVKDPDERKQDILDGAIRVFASKGYEKTSISDIAKEIGVSQGLCYRYFPSKEAMYDAAVDEYAEYIVMNNIHKTKIKGLTLKEQIIQMSGKISEYTATEREEDDLYELFHKAGNHKLHDQLFMKVAEKLVPYITEVLNDAKNRGELHLEDPRGCAYFFVYGQVGILKSTAIKEDMKTEMIQKNLIELLGL